MAESNTLLKVKLHGLGVSPDGQGFVVLLLSETSGKILPIVIGQFEAQAIVMELEKANINRPLTHDLLLNSLKSVDVGVSRVVIDRIQNGTYYAKFFLKQNMKEWFVDARPSDSICLALKSRSPIYVTSDLMETCGQEIEITPTSQPSDLEKLKQDLEQAVQNEDFEKAAAIRDELHKKFSEIKKKIKEEDEPN